MLPARLSVLYIAVIALLSACVQEAPEQTAAVQDAIKKSAIREETVVSQTRALQSALKWKGFYTGRIDGVIGKSTYEALTDYVVASSGGKQKTPTAETINTLVSEYRASIDPSMQGSDDVAYSESSQEDSGASGNSYESRTISKANYSNGVFSGGTVYSADGTATEYTDEAEFESAQESATAGY